METDRCEDGNNLCSARNLRHGAPSPQRLRIDPRHGTLDVAAVVVASCLGPPLASVPPFPISGAAARPHIFLRPQAMVKWMKRVSEDTLSEPEVVGELSSTFTDLFLLSTSYQILALFSRDTAARRHLSG